MDIFYESSADVGLSFVTLNEEESYHCINVLRHKKNDKIVITNGKGYIFDAQIIDENKKRCTVEINSYLKKEKESYLHIALAPTKNQDRVEWFVEKATEIGINEYTPIICERSERKNINIQRLERIVISAMKQSQKAWKPIVNEAISFKDFISKIECNNKYIAHCSENDELKSNKVQLSEVNFKKEKTIVLIGPEGDFSDIEIQNALLKGYKGISLGNSRLRTETAGIIVCCTAYLRSI